MSNIQNKVPLSTSVIKDIHEKLADRLQYDKGQFKKDENYIRGAEFQTAAPSEVLGLISHFVENLNYRLKTDESEEEIIKIILEALIIKKENRGLYTEILHDAQTKEFPNDDDIYDFVSPLMIDEEKRMRSFYNQEKQQVPDDYLED